MSFADHNETARPVRRFRALRWLLRLTLFALVVTAAGFVIFMLTLPADEVDLKRDADGIVVLTGGTSRVSDAVELLAAGRGKRLLISGVFRATNPGEIARRLPEHEKLISCCVDLDRSAVNTLGNATETRRWADERGFRSLIVVTSSYHMPRAMAELGRQLPDVDLIPYPVVSERLRNDPWWSNPDTARVLFSEYVKYVVTLIRVRLIP